MLSNSESEYLNATGTDDTGSQKRVRGASTLKSQDIEWARSVGVEWNVDGQPIGKSSEKLSYAIGCIAKTLSIVYRDWTGVPEEEKQQKWEPLKV